MLWFIHTDCKEGSHHIHESGGGDRTPSQPTGMMNRKCDNQETEWYNPGPQYVSEKVYTGQTSLSIDGTVNESHCHTCLNQLEQSVVVVVGHYIPFNSHGKEIQAQELTQNCMLQMYCCFHTFVIKVPDDGSNKSKQATHWFITLKCCVCIIRWYFNIVQHKSMNQNIKMTHKTNYRDQAAKQQHEQGVWVPGRSSHEGQAAESPLHKIITFSCCDTCRLVQHSHRVVYGYHVL